MEEEKSRKWKMLNLNKAVMEMEAKQGSGVADIFVENLLEVLSDYGFHFRT